MRKCYDKHYDYDYESWKFHKVACSEIFDGDSIMKSTTESSVTVNL